MSVYQDVYILLLTPVSEQPSQTILWTSYFETYHLMSYACRISQFHKAKREKSSYRFDMSFLFTTKI